MNKVYRYLIGMLILINAMLSATGVWSGVVFYEYTWQGEGPQTGEFEINRAYLTYQENLADNLKIKIQTDVGRQQDDPSNPHQMVYLKNARLDWKTDYGTIILGLQGMNMFSLQEKTWGHRFVEKSAMDRNKWSSSADMGIGFTFKLFDFVKGSALLTNGSGYKNPETDDYKKLSLQLYSGEAKLISKAGFNLGGVFSYEKYDVDSVTVGSVTIVGIFGSWSYARLRTGAEYNVKLDSETDDTVTLASAYGDVALTEKLSVFGRVDLAGSGGETDTYLIIGSSIAPVTGLTIAPNVRVQPVDSGTVYSVNFQFRF